MQGTIYPMSHLLIQIQTQRKLYKHSQNNMKNMTREWKARLRKKESALKKKTMQTLIMKQITPGKRNSSGKFKLKHNQKSKTKQIKPSDLSKERRKEEAKPQEPLPSTSYAEATSK